MVQSTRVLRLRIKDKHSAWLCARAREVNTVWNDCNELSVKVFERERKFLSGFDFWPFLKGVTRGDCAMELPVQTVQEVAEQYARSRRQHHKVRLAWRKSAGPRRSLGWIPFKVRTIRYQGGQVYFAGRWLSLWDSFGLGKFALRAGSISQDARGRWYLNVGVRKDRVATKCAPAAVLEAKVPGLGIDLGLKALAAFSDPQLAPVPSRRFYRHLEPALASAQRARKTDRVRAIHARIANRRRDGLHKLSTQLVKRYGAIFVGKVSASQLAKTPLAKSVLDAGWSTFRTMLQYKCDDAGVWFGVWFAEVDESFSTRTCSACASRTGPRGREGLGIRQWTCVACKTIHDRDTNASHNILAAGHRRLAAGILSV